VGLEPEWKPEYNANLLRQLDERVTVALAEENGYWVIPDSRVQMIRRRCEEAGYAR